MCRGFREHTLKDAVHGACATFVVQRHSRDNILLPPLIPPFQVGGAHGGVCLGALL
jgi:hypothetical protein